MSAGEFSIISNIDAFLAGMELENVRSSKKDLDLSKAVLNVSTKIDENMRGVYDRLIPNAHVLDAEYTAKLLIRDLTSNPEKYFSSINIEEDGFMYAKSISAQYLKDARDAAARILTPSVTRTLATKVISAIRDFHSKLPTTKSGNPLTDLNTLMIEPYNQIQQILNTPDISQDSKVAQVSRLGSLFRLKITEVFGSNTALMSAKVPELGSSETRFVFFSKGFDGLSTKINKVISKAFMEGLEASLNVNMVFTVGKEAPIGSVIHFAHTALKSGSDSIINTPAYAKMIFNTANAPDRNNKSPFSSALRASNHFKLKTGHVKVALKVDKSMMSNVGILMQLGLTFTTDHTANLNLLMSTKESNVSKGHYSSSQASNKATRDLLSQRRIGPIVKALVTDNPQFGTSSPTVIDMIALSLTQTLVSGKFKNKKYLYKKNKDITTKYYEPKIPNKLPQLKTLTLKKTPKPIPKSPKTSETSKVRTNLVNLQNLINSQLQDVISANMGDGNSRNVLNYRTGRFAASASVERMSESREGMITAFYSYMKNPYQTFEPGFKQGSPVSRNPKLLISKSIREIAATQVGNRMRAVSI
jgi:hypothetical protein